MKTFLLAMLLLAQRPATPVQTGSISGRLLNSDGTPSARIRVSAMPAPDSPGKPADASTLMTLAETDSNGRYRLADIPVGRYFVVAGSLDSPTYYPRGTLPMGATGINVTAGARIENIDFRIENASSSFSVSGHIKFETSSVQSFFNSRVTLNGGPVNAISYNELTVTPGPDGSFEIQRVRPGTYSLNVSAPFFNPRPITVTDKDVKGIEVVVPWTTDVTGQVVVEENAGPVPQLTTTFSGAGRQTSGYLSNQGFRATLAEGFYAITVTGLPSGFYVKSIEADDTDLTVKPFRVARDQPIPAISITLGVSSPSPWVKISGHIRSSSSTIDTLSLSGNLGSFDARVSADGSFEFPKILPGNYTAYIRSSVSVPTTLQQSFSVVVPLRDLSGIELSIPAVREISGRVEIEGEGPMVRPTLTLTTPPDFGVPVSTTSGSVPTLSQLFATAQTGRYPQVSLSINLQQDGSFKTSLPEGQYQLAASLSQPGNGAVSPYSVKELRYGNVDLNKDPFVVTSELKEMLVKLAPTSAMKSVKVSGRVTGLPSGSPSTVMLFNPLLVNSPVATVAADGSFEFTKVFSGSYNARVSAPAMNSNVIPAQDVMVVDRDITNLQFAAPRLREITGRITMEGKGPLPGFSLFLSSVPNAALANGAVAIQQYFTINPQTDGSFKLTVAEGNWYLCRAANLPPGYLIKDITYGSTSVLNSAIKLNADPAELRVTVTTPNVSPVKVRGNVTNIEALPVQNPPVSVMMSAQGYAISLRAPISADGSFEFPEVFPASYTARLSSVLPNAGTIDTPVIVASRDVSNVVLAIPRMAEITGKVVLEGRGSMPRFFVPLQNVTNASNAGISSQVATLSINPSADGTFKMTLPIGDRRVGVVSGLPAGYTLKSMISGTTDLLTSPLSLKSDDTPELRIVIKAPDVAAVKVSGRVTGMEAVAVRTSIRVRLAAAGFAVSPEAIVASDGAFEFLDVYPGSYTATVVGVPNLTTSSPLVVGSTDVKDALVRVTLPVEVRGRVILDSSVPMPRFSFERAAATSIVPGSATPLAGTFINVNPIADGTFRLQLTDGERPPLTTSNLPAGYTLKSVTYGATDVLRNPLKISRSSPEEFVIVLATSGLKPVSVRGRVDGLNATVLASVAARVLLSSASYSVSLNAAVKADGSFEFSSIYPGTYSAQVLYPSASPAQVPAGPPGQGTGQRGAPPQLNTIVVADKDITDFHVTSNLR